MGSRQSHIYCIIVLGLALIWVFLSGCTGVVRQESAILIPVSSPSSTTSGSPNNASSSAETGSTISAVTSAAAGASVFSGTPADQSSSTEFSSDQSSVSTQAGVETYHFLEFSDFHDTIENWEGEPVLSVLAANLKRRDAENPGRTLILSGGDNVDNSERTLRDEKDAPVMEAFTSIGVDATALGNHEYEDFGIKTFKAETLQDCGFPVLCANLLDRETGESVFEPYKVYDLKGLRVAVIGSSCNKIRDRDLKGKKAPYAYVGHAEAINAQVRGIRESNLADVVLALIHEGGYVDKKGVGGGTLFKIAEALAGVDAVFGGDTHTVAQGRVSDMPVVVPGSHGKGYMEVTLTVDAAGRKTFETRYTNLDTHEPNGYAGSAPIRDETVDAILKAAGY